MNFDHVPVMLDECIENMIIKPEGIYVDGTVGGGGHSLKICERLTTGGLIAIDQDKNALAKASDTLRNHLNKVTFEHNNFSNIKYILDKLGVGCVDGILLDLGVSSHQLDEADRGFSYMKDAPLDMRMNQETGITASDVVNGCSKKELTRIIREYGEERWAVRIAEFIVKERAVKPIETTFELVGAIKKAIPHSARLSGPHPAKRTFQAIRIEVNRELEILEKSVCDCVDRLKSGGRMCVITFHSLEDRIIKTTFKNMVNACTCPQEFPVCICGRKPIAATKKLIAPLKTEIERNNRARSAKLRVAEKL